jgi:hypothetical protein
MAPTRRELLQWVSAVGAASLLPGCGSDDAAPAPSGFFTDDERFALAALANGVLPPDAIAPGSPGGAALGAVAYVERLCTALDGPVPQIFAGGPFSGRRPFPNDAGGPSTNVPPNDFANFLPLDRINERAWRLKLFGSAKVEGGGPNDAILGPQLGLRDQIKIGVADAAKRARQIGPLDKISIDDAATLYTDSTAELKDLLIDLVTEAAFSNPEYGGNQALVGWKLARYEGDVLPLGFSVYDAASGKYKEIPGSPVAGPGGADPAAMNEETLAFVRIVVSFLGGEEVK